MASVQHLPYNPTADTIELADGSRWVREKTCHVVEFARCTWRTRCGADPWADADSVTEHCPNCGHLSSTRNRTRQSRFKAL